MGDVTKQMPRNRWNRWRFGMYGGSIDKFAISSASLAQFIFVFVFFLLSFAFFFFGGLICDLGRGHCNRCVRQATQRKVREHEHDHERITILDSGFWILDPGSWILILILILNSVSGF